MFQFGGAWSFVWGAKPTKALPWRRDWRVGAGKFLGVRRVFVQTCPKKTLKKITSQRKTIAFHFGHIFFISKHIKRHFAQIFPKKTTKKWRPKTLCTLILCAIFLKSKRIKRFCDGFHTFCPNFKGYCPRIFTKSNFWGCASTPASYTSGFLVGFITAIQPFRLCPNC